MKCWKCGQELPDGTKKCVYCGASQNRTVPKTEPGRAMRKLYDQFGAQKVFSEPAYLANGLGDLLPDSQKLRGHLKSALDAGIGRLYLDQLREKGSSDADFRKRVRTLLIEDAKISEKDASALTGYLDEMIGWKKKAEKKPAGSVTPEKPSGKIGWKAAEDLSPEGPSPKGPSPKGPSPKGPSEDKQAHAPSAGPQDSPRQVSPPAPAPAAFPAEGVPKPEISLASMMLGMIVPGVLMGLGAGFAGPALLLIPIGLVIAYVYYFRPLIRIAMFRPSYVTMRRDGSLVECRLKTTKRGLRSIWYVAVNGQWVLNGTGESLLLRDASGTPLPGRQLVILLQNVPAGADIHLCARSSPGGKLHFVYGQKVS